MEGNETEVGERRRGGMDEEREGEERRAGEI